MIGRLAAAPAVLVERGPARVVRLGVEDHEWLDAFVAASPHAHFRQASAWARVLADEGRRTILLGAEVDGVLRASIALAVRRVPGTPWTVLSGNRGPVLDPADTRSLGLLVEGIRRVARAERAVFLRLDPDWPDDDAEVRAGLARHGFRHLARGWSAIGDPRFVMRVDLRPSEAALLAAMRKKHRQHINGVDRRGLKLRTATDAQDVERFAALMHAHGREKGFPVRDAAYFRALWREWIQPGSGELFLVERGGEVGAGGLVLLCGRRSWFLYTATAPEIRGLFPGEAIYWEVLRWSKARGAESCDFGAAGTAWPPAEGNHGYPRYFFKLGFGARETYLTGYHDLVFRPLLYRLLRLGEERVLEESATVLDLLRRLSG